MVNCDGKNYLPKINSKEILYLKLVSSYHNIRYQKSSIGPFHLLFIFVTKVLF